MQSPRPQPLHRPPSVFTRKSGVEAAPVPAHLAPVAIMAEADHVRRTAPDTLAGLVLPPHGMTAPPPPAIGHAQGLLRDDHRRGGEMRNGPHQGGEIIDDHLRGEVMTDDRCRGVVTRDERHVEGVTRDDCHRGVVMREDCHQGVVMRDGHHQRGVVRDNPLNERSQAVRSP